MIEILLVEDNPGDVDLVKEALSGTNLPSRLRVAADGLEALSLLGQTEIWPHGGRPDLILLDLNLPKKTGLEVLGEIKGDARLKKIPVVILSSSAEEKDVVESYGLHANCYVSKPVDLDGFISVLKSIENFWLRVAKLPPKENSWQIADAPPFHYEEDAKGPLAVKPVEN